MLASLRHHSVVGRDNQHGNVNPGGSGDHVANKPLVPGNVDDANPQVAIGNMSEAQVDGNAAGFLFGQPVRIHPRQLPDQPRLAMIDVPSRSDQNASCRSRIDVCLRCRHE